MMPDRSAALLSDAPREDELENMKPFDRLIGDWKLEITDIAAGGSQQRFNGTWQFFWGLGGRAILDVWKVPGREHGITVRFFDPRIGAWRSTWIAPQGGLVLPFIGRYIEGEIVLEYADESGAQIRWIFSDIAEDSFRWRGERMDAGGMHWILEQTMVAERALHGV